MGEREPDQPVRRLTPAQVRALFALTQIESVLVCEGEHHIWRVPEASFKALARYGLAKDEDGIYSITDAGREEAKHWPR